MKINRLTIPAPQNIKRRETFLLKHAEELPKSYVQAQLLKIAKIRAEKKLRWESYQTPKAPLQERIEETAKNLNLEYVKPTPKTFFSRVKGMFKGER